MLSALLLSSLFQGSAADGPAAPFDLRCELMPSPVRGVGAAPRLAWKLAHAARDTTVQGYSVEVLRVADSGGSNVTVWSHDQAVHAGVDPLGVTYGSAGKALLADTEYVWRVRWSDGARQSAWSESAVFATGLFSDTDWRGAQWIGVTDHLDDKSQFRKTLTVPRGKTLSRCSMMVSGLGYFRAHIEGRRVGDHELGESTQFESQLPYTALDCSSEVASALEKSGGARAVVDEAPGTTALENRPILDSSQNSAGTALGFAVELGRGWYAEQLVGALGNHPSGQRMLRMLVTLTFTDGTQLPLVTDGSWKRGAGPIVDEQLHLGIVYDAQRETPGWTTAAFDDVSWVAPDLTAMARSPKLVGSEMTSMIHPGIRKTRTIVPSSLTVTVENTWLLDVGQNIAGWCSISFPLNSPSPPQGDR